MYMIVFITLMVALIGAYSQMFSLQAMRLYSAQKGVAQTMMTWHSAAVGTATNLVTPTSITNQGCYLTNNLTGQIGGAPIMPACQSQGFLPISIGTTGAAPACTGNVGQPCAVYLPNGFQTGTYQFYSVAFQNTTAPIQNYVLTFVPPPPSGGDYPNLKILCLPGVDNGTACPPTQAQLTLSLADLYKQLKQGGFPFQNFGYVIGGQLVTPTIQQTINGALVAQTITYPLPVSIQAIVPNNSVGIITAFPACTSC